MASRGTASPKTPDKVPDRLPSKVRGNDPGKVFGKVPGRGFGREFGNVPGSGLGRDFGNVPGTGFWGDFGNVPGRGFGRDFGNVPGGGFGRWISKVDPDKPRTGLHSHIPNLGRDQKKADLHRSNVRCCEQCLRGPTSSTPPKPPKGALTSQCLKDLVDCGLPKNTPPQSIRTGAKKKGRKGHKGNWHTKFLLLGVMRQPNAKVCQNRTVTVKL
jgi:hypothetical protein